MQQMNVTTKRREQFTDTDADYAEVEWKSIRDGNGYGIEWVWIRNHQALDEEVRRSGSRRMHSDGLVMFRVVQMIEQKFNAEIDSLRTELADNSKLTEMMERDFMGIESLKAQLANDANDADNKQTVPSSTTAQTYVIAYDNIKECYTCSCPYYMYRRASKDELCKHITKLKSTGRLPIQPVK